MKNILEKHFPIPVVGLFTGTPRYLCLPPLVCANTHCVQPCATTMLHAVHAVLQKMKNPFNASTFGQCTTNDT